jgi:eukaryotic-like serine/threonine-protein kinase
MFCASCLFTAMSQRIQNPPLEPPESDPETRPQNGNNLSPGKQLDDYTIGELISHGGMGIIYHARQIDTDREVALKMIRSGLFATEIDIARFRLEIRTVSRLHHPNIVPIFDLGEWQSLPYYTMQFINGRALSEHLENSTFSITEAVDLIITIAEAVHSAHQAGVIHRDLKPGNILLDENRVPYVTDFGLARDETSDSSMTVTGQILGTPSYLPPEQADYQEELVGVRSDVYSLGAILYHLLCGQPPFKARSSFETIQLVKEKEALSPQKHSPKIPNDLGTIALKCLKKNANERYPSAHALADDLRCWKSGFPISARPISTLERSLKWARRQPVVALLLVSIFVTATTATGAVWWQWRSAVRAQEQETLQRERAETALEEKSKQLNDVYLDRSEDLQRRGRENLSLAQLAQILRNDPNHLSAAWIFADRARSHQIQSPQLIKLENAPSLSIARFVDTGKTIMGANLDGQAGYWNSESGFLHSRLFHHDSTVLDMIQSTDGSVTATATESGAVYLWDNDTGSTQHPRFLHKNPAQRILVTKDLEILVVKTRSRRVHIWDIENRTRVGPVIVHRAAIQALELSPDESKLLTGSHDGRLCLWELRTGRLIDEIAPKLSWVNSAAFHPNGKNVIASFSRRAAAIWNPLNDIESLIPFPHENRVNYAMFVPNRDMAFTCSRDFTARIWNTLNGEPIGSPMVHPSWVLKAWPAANGDQLITYTSNQRLHRWDLATNKQLAPEIRIQSDVLDLLPDPETTNVKVVTSNGYVASWTKLLNQPEPRTLAHEHRIGKFTLSQNGRWIASTVENRQIHLWDRTTWQRVHRSKAFRSPIQELQFTDDSAQLEAITRGGEIFTFDISDGLAPPRVVSSPFQIPNATVMHSSDRQHSVLLTKQGFIIDTHSDESDRQIEVPIANGLNKVIFLANGSLFITEEGNDRLSFWDTTTWKRKEEPIVFDSKIENLRSSPDSQTLAVTRADNNVTLLQKKTLWRKPISLRHTGGIREIRFSESGRLLATACNDRSAWVWDRNGSLVAGPMEHQDDVMSLAFTGDETILATGSRNGEVRIWNVRDGHSLGEPWKHNDRVIQLDFTQDSQFLLSASWDKTLRITPVTPPSLPVPSWLPPWLEAIAGVRLTNTGQQIPVPIDQLYELNNQLLEEPTGDAYTELITPILK